MISSVLVVCAGNTCRSPVGARLLAQACPDLRVASAGITALEGHPASRYSVEVAVKNGMSLEGHVARQFTAEMAAKFDLILVMEMDHMKITAKQAPKSAGKTMLFGQTDIADPYHLSREFYETVFCELEKAAAGWAVRLGANVSIATLKS